MPGLHQVGTRADSAGSPLQKDTVLVQKSTVLRRTNASRCTDMDQVVSWASERRADGAEHLLAHHGDGRRAVRQEAVVELLERRVRIRRHTVAAQLANHELTERICQITRIVGATQRLLAGVAGIGERLL